MVSTHIEEFISHYAERLEKRVDSFESLRSCEYAKISEVVGLEVAWSARAVLASWRQLLREASQHLSSVLGISYL